MDANSISKLSDDSRELESHEKDMLSVVEEVVRELPPGAANVVVTTKDSEMVIEVLPVREGAAKVWVHTDVQEIVDFAMGTGRFVSTWELKWEGSHHKPSYSAMTEDVRDMCRAVFAGECRHRTGLLTIKGEITTPTHRYKMTNVLEFVRPLSTYNYLPYSDGNS